MAASAADAKTGLTSHIEGVEALLGELEEKVAASAATDSAGSVDAGALVSELKASMTERVEGMEAMLAELEEKTVKLHEASDQSSSSIKELTDQLSAHASTVASTKEQLVAQMDSDGDGTIDKSEFTVWAGEQASRVDTLEKRLEAALDEAKTVAAESSSAATTKGEELEAWIIDLEAKVETAGDSTEMDGKVQELFLGKP